MKDNSEYKPKPKGGVIERRGISEYQTKDREGAKKPAGRKDNGGSPKKPVDKEYKVTEKYSLTGPDKKKGKGEYQLTGPAKGKK